MVNIAHDAARAITWHDPAKHYPVIATGDQAAYEAYGAACQAEIAKCSAAIDEIRANAKALEDAATAARDQAIAAHSAVLDRRLAAGPETDGAA